jgi:NNP family nitrate/nitrite transporter-like MFS transporter
VLLGSIMRIPLGWLTDRHGGRLVFTALMALTPIPLVGLALWHDAIASILILGLVLGFAGASFAVGVPFVNHWYAPERRGFALGVYGVGMGGTVVAAMTAPRIVDSLSLDAPFWIAAIALGAMALVFWTTATDAPGSAHGKSGSMLASLSAFKGPGSGRAWALTLFYFMAFGGFVAMFLYLPKLLTGVHDLEKTDAGVRAAGFALLAVIGRPVGGILSDRVGAGQILRVAFTAVAVLALVLAVGYESMVPLTIACLTMAVALGLGTGAVFKLVPEWFPDRVGPVTGVVGAAGGLGGFFPPLVMGMVKTATGGYALGFVLMALVAFACLAVLTGLRVGAPR